MTSEHFYSNDSQLVDQLLHEMATRKIVRVGKFFFHMCTRDWIEYVNVAWRV